MTPCRYAQCATTRLRYIQLMKTQVDFPLVLIELFSLDVTAESLRVKGDRKSAISLQRGQFDPIFQVEEVAPHQSFLRG